MIDTTKVEGHAKQLDAVVDSIVEPYTKDLSAYIDGLKNIAKDQNYSDLSLSELSQSILFISASLYSLANNMEKTSLRQAVATAIKDEQYNLKYSSLKEGTIADRTSIAQNFIVQEKLVETCYKNAYSRMRNLFESGNNLYSGLRRIASMKTAELGLASKKEYLA